MNEIEELIEKEINRITRNKQAIEGAYSTHAKSDLKLCNEMLEEFIDDLKQLKQSLQPKHEPTVHELKIQPKYFNDVISGIKTFEIRKNDRDYKVGDILVLQEYTCGSYTDESITLKVTYITDYEQKDGYVVLGIVPVEEEKRWKQ